MKIPTLFKEYIWLIETIYQAGKITFAEINEKWKRREDSGGLEFSRTTFNRHRDAILDMFGVIIECNHHDGYRYYIYNKEVLSDDSVANWLFTTLSVGNMLDENIGLQDRILLESIPSGDVHLKRIIKAMREGRKMMMQYRKYSAATAKSYLAAPYCVKLFKRRWYVLTKIVRPIQNEPEKTGPSMSVFSLDRIVDVQLTNEKFTLDADFDAAGYFADSFGIMVDTNTKPERIVLRAYGMEKYYMRDLPLHPSQREIAATDEYADFEIRLRPSSDFKAHILSRGEWLQIIQPQWLADDMRNWLQAAIGKYKD
ncbi:MAG: WYL domain-containing protein [Bacteroidaceae bacterium]|nr:WYL domain-containing protein [Bacteroidaceae bacterium]